MILKLKKYTRTSVKIVLITFQRLMLTAINELIILSDEFRLFIYKNFHRYIDRSTQIKSEPEALVFFFSTHYAPAFVFFVELNLNTIIVCSNTLNLIDFIFNVAVRIRFNKENRFNVPDSRYSVNTNLGSVTQKRLKTFWCDIYFIMNYFQGNITQILFEKSTYRKFCPHT